MDIQDMRIFMRVAALCNLSAVGAELGLTPGTISKRIQALEDHLGARLFDRTTRRIRITEEGEIFLAHVERIMAEIADARAAVGGNVALPRGRLSISAPASLARRFIAPALCVFMRKYPDVELRIDLTDQIVNLYDEGYDVAIRTGALPDSTLIAKRLAPDRHVIVASSDYMSEHGVPQDPRDLVDHNCLVLGDHRQWSFTKDGEQQHIRVTGSLRSNSGDLLRHAATDGKGIIRTSELRVMKELNDGTLVRVLPTYNVTARAAIWAVYPSAKHVLPKLRVFLDFLADWFTKAQQNVDMPSTTGSGPHDMTERGGSHSVQISG
ncbi:MAG: LysR family transcriptional regulator [Hyphomicrobiaceae bacterium]